MAVENPYESPKTTPVTTQGFRWRLIPAALMMCWGVLRLSGAAISIWVCMIQSNRYSYLLNIRLDDVLLAVVGCMWITGGVCIWMRRWIITGIAVLLAMVLGCVLFW